MDSIRRPSRRHGVQPSEPTLRMIPRSLSFNLSRSSQTSPNPTVSHRRNSSNPLDTDTERPSPRLPDDGQDPARLSSHFRGLRRLEQRRSMEQQHYLINRAREQNYNPPVDLRLLEHITPHDENLMCAICRCAFVDPVVLSDCGHCFCRDCIRQTWNSSSSYTPLGPRGACPSCRAPAKIDVGSATAAMSNILKNITDDLMVKCPRSEEGCRQVLKRGGVQDHMGIYCGYALVECPAQGCGLPIRRHDISRGCLHYGVSCLACRKEFQVSTLEQHWRGECPGRVVRCESCNAQVLHRKVEDHRRNTCPAASIPCPGKELGCSSKGTRGQVEIHVNGCTFAKLAPIFAKQQERLDEQEAAQKQMSRKMDMLKDAFDAMQSLLYPSSRQLGPPDEIRMPLSEDTQNQELDAMPVVLDATASPSNFDLTNPSSTTFGSDSSAAMTHGIHTTPNSLLSRPAPGAPGPRPNDLPQPFTSDFDLVNPVFPSPTTDGAPYASPLHHLLSLHESLRDEVSRMSAALSELDGRHSMQNLNENLRTREEISYIGAQVAGLQRQVHWLTSAQLQRQGPNRAPPTAVTAATAGPADASAGVGVEAAVSAVSNAASALTGAARAIHRDGLGMRRGPSEEGRTKL